MQLNLDTFFCRQHQQMLHVFGTCVAHQQQARQAPQQYPGGLANAGFDQVGQLGVESLALTIDRLT